MTASAVYVTVSVRDETYALPIASVLEVAELGEISTLPGAGTGVLGLRNFHGQVLPVFELAHALGTGQERRPSRLVVLDHGGRLAGLAVDEIANVGPLAGDVEEAESDYLVGSVLEDGQLVGVVDVDRVLDAFQRGAS
jgi:purine-binding chemotaxis protein CheW